MMAAILKRSGTWLPTVLVLIVVLLAGARLVMLSLNRHADDDRGAARTALVQAKASFEAQLQKLTERATNPGAGTPEPETIGRTESHGCIRLTNWDAARLAQMVRPGTPVTLQD